jgi:hypothetical protein
VSSPKDAALAVSRIPYQLGILAPSETTTRLIDQNLSNFDENVLKRANKSDDFHHVAGWHTRHSSTNYATENFYAPIASPQTMLLLRSGSLIEHAILLCGLFLGMGYQSYIAIGKGISCFCQLKIKC